MSIAGDAGVSGKGLLMKADRIASTFDDELRASLANFSLPLKLVGILSTSSGPSKSYAEFTRKQCLILGVDFELRKTGAALSSELGEGDGVEDAIIEANEDSSVDGIMVR
jgi:methylenetetrahydrofolate dehydrogenase (NAD+)